MKAMLQSPRKIVLVIGLLGAAVLLGMATAIADRPLSKDDVTLLLLGNSSDKIISIVQQRGVDFQMSPDLAKKFHDQGASDDLIDALQKAANKATTVAPNAPTTPPPSADTKPNAPDAPQPPADVKPNSPVPAAKAQTTPPPATPPANSKPVASAPPNEPVMRQASAPPSSDEPVLHGKRTSGDTNTAPPTAPAAPVQPAAPVVTAKNETPAPPATKSAPGLKDPSAEEIQHIIQQFAAKEKIFREARNNYTYHQVNRVEELGADNEVVGTFQQEWDILYEDSGKRIERVTYAPPDTLKNLIVTQEDLENFRNIQPFVLSTEEVPEYEIKYLGHVKVDEITAYVFSIRPKEFQKGRLYFQGVVWVDDRDLQIVKSEGKTVPELKGKKGQNMFPRFTTWREQIDGKFWFPTYTLADDTLYFPNGPAIHLKEIVRYSDYKQFKSGVRILTVEGLDKQKEQTNSPPPPAAPSK